jgi:(p)ppGpp synthase/HD superfamily hydrolase
MDTMQAYIERMHVGQKRQDGTTAATHVTRVATLLEAALTLREEKPDTATLASLVTAALGHDLLEDTAATEEEIRAIAGDTALEYIKTLTNRFGDDHPTEYTTQVVTGSEEARLIKLCDLTDNLFHASYSSALLGVKWMHEYFLPIVDPMREALSKTSFTRYPKTGEHLITVAALARAHLDSSIERVKP